MRPKALLAFLFLPVVAEAGGDTLRLSSPDFRPGGFIPARFTCEGDNTSPTLEIAGVPTGTKSLCLIVEDPDAPGGTFTHWLVWNIPSTCIEIPPGKVPAGAAEGTNDFGKPGYGGPCPPSGTHRYFFRLFALDVSPALPAGASRNDVVNAIHPHILGRVDLMGRYAKSGDR